MDRQTERDYREALDALRFSGEGKERIMKNLMEEGKRPVKAKRFKVMRAGLIAAAVCVALVGTVFAVTEQSRMRVNWGDSGISTDGYSVECAVNFYPLNRFSGEVAAMAGLDPSQQHKYFDTWDELQSFTGVELVRNTVLDGAQPGPIGTLPWEYDRGSQDPDKTHLMLETGATDDGELRIVQAVSTNLIDGFWVRMIEGIYTERAEGTLYYAVEGSTSVNGRLEQVEGDGMHARAGLVYGEGYEVTQENYTTPNGLDALIILAARPAPKKSTMCSAYFLIDGAYFQLIVGGNGPYSDLPQPEPQQAMEILKRVLDGFVLE